MAFIDHKGQWAGGGATSDPATKEDSNVWFDFKNGKIYYKAMGSSVFERTEVAEFGNFTDEPTEIDNSSWLIQNTLTAENVQEEERVKIYTTYFHKYGINNVTLQGRGGFNTTTQGTPTFNREARCIVRVGGQSDFTVLSSGSNPFSVTVDVSGLTDGENYILEVALWDRLEGTGFAVDEEVEETVNLREDVSIVSST